MKNPFKKNLKPEPEKKTRRPKLEMVEITIPLFQIEGKLFRVEEDRLKILKPAFQVFKELDTKISVTYDPYIHHDMHQYTEITFIPNYYYHGRGLGKESVNAVHEIGLEFPNHACPWASEVKVNNDGGVTWRATFYPEAEQIATVVEEVNRQILEILRDFSRTDAIMRAKGAK
jgi:hypothetical protein